MSAGEGWGLGATGPVGGGGVFHLSDTDKEDERGLSLRPRVRGVQAKRGPSTGNREYGSTVESTSWGEVVGWARGWLCQDRSQERNDGRMRWVAGALHHRGGWERNDAGV